MSQLRQFCHIINADRYAQAAERSCVIARYGWLEGERVRESVLLFSVFSVFMAAMMHLDTQISPTWTPISSENKLIVLHTPKCGGSSLRCSLTATFGQGAIYMDYKFIKGRPISPYKSINEPVIYGHFQAVKYDHVKGVWVTLLREPVDRMLSLYFNWRFSSPKPPNNNIGALRRNVRRGKIDLLEFARLPSMANRICGHYLAGFDMDRFSLIIPHDNYTAGVERLGELIGRPLRVMTRNVSASKSEQYEKARRDVLADETRLRELRNILSAEIAFYERCMRLPTTFRK